MKTKTYVLTLSARFPKGHPREGEETHFAEAFMRGAAPAGLGKGIFSNSPKIHTIRADYDLWKKRIDEVNAGRAALSVREWLGAPRRSKQHELFRFDRDSGIGVEGMTIDGYYFSDEPDGWHRRWYEIGRDGKVAEVRDCDLATNDGLTLADWLAWFRGCDKSQPMAIIHFTKFRYCK